MDIDKILNGGAPQGKPKKLGKVMIDEPEEKNPDKDTIDIVCSPLNMSRKLQT